MLGCVNYFRITKENHAQRFENKISYVPGQKQKEHFRLNILTRVADSWKHKWLLHGMLSPDIGIIMNKFHSIPLKFSLTKAMLNWSWIWQEIWACYLLLVVCVLVIQFVLLFWFGIHLQTIAYPSQPLPLCVRWMESTRRQWTSRQSAIPKTLLNSLNQHRW